MLSHPSPSCSGSPAVAYNYSEESSGTIRSCPHFGLLTLALARLVFVDIKHSR
jgi:hypothetical protein